MKIILSRFLILTFLLLALIHFYWAFGGNWGFENVLPTNEQGISVFSPTKIEAIIIGLVLLLFGVFYMVLSDMFKANIHLWIVNFALWGIPIIFILRAIGEFKYVGFFKQIKGTDFANLDTMFYSPLCLIIGLSGVFLAKMR